MKWDKVYYKIREFKVDYLIHYNDISDDIIERIIDDVWEKVDIMVEWKVRDIIEDIERQS